MKKLRPIQRVYFGWTLAFLLSIAPRAGAKPESTFIIVGQQSPENSDAEPLFNRLRGELSADGLEVAPPEVPPPENDDALVALLAQKAHAAGAAVGAALIVNAGGRSIDLTLVDTATGRVLHRRIEGEADRFVPEILARRSVDLLRASLLDFVVESLRAAMAIPKATNVPPPPQPRPQSPPASPRELRVILDGGIGVLTSLQGIGPAVLPVLRLGASTDRHWSVRATVAWLGTRPTVVAPTGSASIEQGIAILEGVVSPWTTFAVRPRGTLGLGTYYLRANGSGVSPFNGAQNAAVAFAAAGGLGIAAAVAPSYDLALDVQAIVTAPGLAVRFLDDNSVRAGRPEIFATLTISGSL